MLCPLRIVIAEDELLLRSMLRLFCESEPSWHVVGEADDCESACSVVEGMQPDIVLLDLALGMESGLDCLPQLLNLGANRVLVLTGNGDPDVHARALAVGACDVLVKGDSSQKILQAIREQATTIAQKKNQLPISSQESGCDTIDSEQIPMLRPVKLDMRDKHIIELLAAGHKDNDIADELHLSLSGMHHILTSIYQKLGVRNRVELVVYAFQHQLAVPPSK